MKVVLVHGFLNRGGILRKLAQHLEREGHTCYLPSLKPCDARCGLPTLADQLQHFIAAELPTGERFALVGFSMGAIIGRYYLQELGGGERTSVFVSIAGPHQGTWSAYLYPGEGVRQLRYQGEFIRQLERSNHRIARLPKVSYWTPFDLMIRPVASTRWAEGEVVRIPSLLHSLLVFDPRLFRDLARRLAAL